MGVKAEDIRDAVRKKYNDPRRYAIADEVGLSTGGSRRRIDMVVVDCYASNGFRIDGIEIKVSRADLRRELEDPDKHVCFFDRIDYFTLACPQGLVTDLNLLPPKWGLLEVYESGATRYRRRPLALQDEVLKTVPRGFFAGYIRAIQGYAPSVADLKAEYKRGFDAGVAREHDRRTYAQRTVDEHAKELEEYRKLMQRLNVWSDPEIKLEEFERFRKANPDWALTSMKRTVQYLRDLINAFEGTTGGGDTIEH